MALTSASVQFYLPQFLASRVVSKIETAEEEGREGKEGERGEEIERERENESGRRMVSGVRTRPRKYYDGDSGATNVQ